MDPTEVEPHTSTLVTGYVVRVGPKVHFDFNLSRQFLEASTDHHQIYHSLAKMSTCTFRSRRSKAGKAAPQLQHKAGLGIITVGNPCRSVLDPSMRACVCACPW